MICLSGRQMKIQLIFKGVQVFEITVLKIPSEFRTKNCFCNRHPQILGKKF